jgi:FlaA1/EpsC-like NDP-sugar epimerase
MTHALTWCAANGHTAVALYGGGQHTRDLLPRLTGAPVNIIAVIDDDPNRQGRTIARVPTIDPSRIDDTVATAIIISSDAAEPALIERSANFAGARPVIRLYGTAATTLCARSGHACVVRPHAELCA